MLLRTEGLHQPTKFMYKLKMVKVKVKVKATVLHITTCYNKGPFVQLALF